MLTRVVCFLDTSSESINSLELYACTVPGDNNYTKITNNYTKITKTKAL